VTYPATAVSPGPAEHEGTPTRGMVRKAVERVKARYASRQSMYFEGQQANYDLCAHLVATGVLAGEDLRRLAGRNR